MKEKDTNRKTNREIDKNFFKEMNYELAGEIGVLDNEDMQENKKLDGKNKKDKKK